MYQFVRFFLFTALVVLSSSAFAQKGFLRGKITDGEFGEGLFGATVVQQGRNLYYCGILCFLPHAIF